MSAMCHFCPVRWPWSWSGHRSDHNHQLQAEITGFSLHQDFGPMGTLRPSHAHHYLYPTICPSPLLDGVLCINFTSLASFLSYFMHPDGHSGQDLRNSDPFKLQGNGKPKIYYPPRKGARKRQTQERRGGVQGSWGDMRASMWSQPQWAETWDSGTPSSKHVSFSFFPPPQGPAWDRCRA